VSWFLCSLPIARLYNEMFGCSRPGVLAHLPRNPTRFDALLTAPFWERGGVLYAHLRLPHPPGAGNEPTLAAAYQHNLALVEQLVGDVADRLRQAPFASDFVLIVTSDHHLRVNEWCSEEPYRSQGCEVSEALKRPEVPFIVATPAPLPGFVAPRTNGGLFPVVDRLSAR
jgi:hypothetical protein